MPLDGSYGRLSAHKQRAAELRAKNKERRDRSRKMGTSGIRRKVTSKAVDQKELEAIQAKMEIQQKKRFRKNLIIGIVSAVLAILAAIYFFVFVFDSPVF